MLDLQSLYYITFYIYGWVKREEKYFFEGFQRLFAGEDVEVCERSDVGVFLKVFFIKLQLLELFFRCNFRFLRLTLLLQEHIIKIFAHAEGDQLKGRHLLGLVHKCHCVLG